MEENRQQRVDVCVLSTAEAAANRPRLQVDDGVLHCPLVVFAHVLVHVRVVGADVLLRAAVGHRAELEGRVLLLRVLELVKQREVRGRERAVVGGGDPAARPPPGPTHNWLVWDTQIKSAGRRISSSSAAKRDFVAV